MDYLSKMFAALMLVLGINTAAGFNIFTKPVDNFRNDDKLFGQTIIKSKNGVFVPSPSNGKIFKCTLDSHCSMVKEIGDLQKGQIPITSISSSLSEEDERVLVCDQVRTTKASTEHLNGFCTYMNDAGLDYIRPADLVLEQLKQNVTDDSSTGCPQAHSRRKRQAEPNQKVEDEDDENPETEIAFVLDGSGSIEKEDFELAKDFIYNVMTKVWESCFTCNFAVVQFGTEIRTELSLLDNNTEQALKKVKDIQQLGNYTKTASALYHVLTEVFVPENGSKLNSKKFIIVLSDGQILADNRTLTDVLAMPQMKGVNRFAIGVGPQVLNNKKAKEEMNEIAGSPNKFFGVSNYNALETILSCLKNQIIWVEGMQKGAGFQLQLGEAGFSSHLTHEGSMLFGAVGAYDWSGGIILKRNGQTLFLNATKEEPRFSYLGYSVASARMATKTLYISGAPRYNLTGAVFIFNGTNQDLLQGDQVGSYFGSVLCALDIDNNQETDYLLVGAPHFHEKGEEGNVLVYKLHQGRFEREDYVLHGMGKYIYARFGSAIADIGDIDGDKYNDVAIGAPLEAADDMTDSTGSIYIYNGCEDGIKKQFSQRVSPSDFGIKLVHFGQAVSAMYDSKKDKERFISVGSEGVVTVFKAVPVIVINPKIDVDRAEISLAEQTNDKSRTFKIKLRVCFDEQRGKIHSDEQLIIEYQIDLDSGKEEKRLVDAENPEKTNFTMSSDKNCIEPRHLQYMGCYDCFSPIKIKLNIITLVPPSVRVLDAFSPKEYIKEIQFEKECKDLKNCIANISLADSKLSNDLITVGSSETLSITFNLANSGESSYMTTLTVTFPKILQSKKIDGGQCEMKNEDLQIACRLLHPVFKKNAQTTVTITWQPRNEKSDLTTATINAVLTGGHNGTEKLDSMTYDFGVKNSLKLKLISTASPNRLTKEEEKKTHENLHFTFKMLGENKYKAKINVTITIVNKTHNTEVSIRKAEPQSCVWLWVQTESHYRIECTLTDLQDIVVMADTLIHDVTGTDEMITATAELSFDEDIFGGNDIGKTSKVEVTIGKLIVVKSTAPIIGGSIGGFLLLIIIIIILIKCGFFRRRHQVDRAH